MSNLKEVPPTLSKKEKKKLISAFQKLKTHFPQVKQIKNDLFKTMVFPVYNGIADDLNDLKHQYSTLMFVYEFFDEIE